MTKKDFFRLLIKIFGLYSIITILFSIIPTNIIWSASQMGILGIIWVIATLIIIISLFILLIYKSDVIIHWLKLEKGFDEDRMVFENFNTENILKLAVIIIGGILFIENIPAFLSHTLFAFKSSLQSAENMTDGLNTKEMIYWLTSFLNIVLGYLMLTNYSYISRLLKKMNDKNDK